MEELKYLENRFAKLMNINMKACRAIQCESKPRFTQGELYEMAMIAGQMAMGVRQAISNKLKETKLEVEVKEKVEETVKENANDERPETT